MAKTYEPIATTTLGSAAASYTFSSISGSYTDLILVVDATTTAGNRALQLVLNSDTGTNYSATYITGDGSSTASSRNSSTG
jgi:ethanolamine utilization microcompartment shell protein EutL